MACDHKGAAGGICGNCGVVVSPASIVGGAPYREPATGAPAYQSPPKSPADELRELVTVMREMGVTKYEHGDVRLELGPALVQSPPITDAQRRLARQDAQRQNEALLYASSEGFPIDEEASV